MNFVAKRESKNIETAESLIFSVEHVGIPIPSDISRRNPQDDFDLLCRIGSGTYGDVYKARGSFILFLFTVIAGKIFIGVSWPKRGNFAFFWVK